jgi:hypothetical protein
MVGPFGAQTAGSQFVQLVVNNRHQLIERGFVAAAPLPKELRHRRAIWRRLHAGDPDRQVPTFDAGERKYTDTKSSYPRSLNKLRKIPLAQEANEGVHSETSLISLEGHEKSKNSEK